MTMRNRRRCQIYIPQKTRRGRISNGEFSGRVEDEKLMKE